MNANAIRQMNLVIKEGLTALRGKIARQDAYALELAYKTWMSEYGGSAYEEPMSDEEVQAKLDELDNAMDALVSAAPHRLQDGRGPLAILAVPACAPNCTMLV